MKRTKDLCKCFFKRELRKQRFKLGINQEQMSELLRISPRSYSDLENGKYMCSAMVLICLILYCDVNANVLFGELKEFIEEN